MGKYTLTMIKPTAMKNGHAGEILEIITKEGGFRIAAMKMLTLSVQRIGRVYDFRTYYCCCFGKRQCSC